MSSTITIMTQTFFQPQSYIITIHLKMSLNKNTKIFEEVIVILPPIRTGAIFIKVFSHNICVTDNFC